MWGKLHESTAFDQYQSMHSSKSGLILRKSGIFISSEDGFLAASPDGILHNNENKCGMLEIKCPYSCRNLTVLEACNQVKAFCCEVVNNEIHLKKSHDYYYQVQGALAIAKVEWCDFVVWTTKDMHTERIIFDQSFWNTCYLRLKTVYLSYILPEIIYPRIPIDLEIIHTYTSY